MSHSINTNMTNQEIAEEFEMTLDELSEVNQLPNEIKRFINDLREFHRFGELRPNR